MPSPDRPPVVLLGPQRFAPTLAEAVRALGIDGRIATITAGWQEREADDAELDAHLGGRSINLGLNARAARAFARDPRLAAAHRARQDRLRSLEALYALRLNHAMDAAYGLLRRLAEDDPELVGPEVDDAFAAVQALDAHHLARVREVRERFAADAHLAEREAVVAEREAIADLLCHAQAVAIAGGHIAALLNRLRLFDLGGLIGRLPVLAWSAGAMALTDRVVVFHDHPPQGPGYSAVLDAGLGLASGLVALPHAHRRLRLDNPVRVVALARRYRPAVCLALEDGGQLRLERGRTAAAERVLRLGADGSVLPLPPGAEAA